MTNAARRPFSALEYSSVDTSVSVRPDALMSNGNLVTAFSPTLHHTNERFHLRNLANVSSAPRTVAGESLPRGATVGSNLFERSGAMGWVNPKVSAEPGSSARSQLIAEWHGQVVAIESDYFVAELKGTIGANVVGSLEEAMIPRDEIRPEDRELLGEGAFFRLCVNWEFFNGSKRRVTDLVFRRMPAYRRDELEEARKTAADLFHALRVE